MIIGLTEKKAKIKQKKNLSEYSIPGCDLFVNEKPKRGVAMYTSKKLNVLECEEFDVTDCEGSV